MGEVTSGLSVNGTGRLEITYKSQMMCQDGSKKVPYTTHLQFVCEKSALVCTCKLFKPVKYQSKLQQMTVFFFCFFFLIIILFF